jgi:hypothetical protein
MAIILVVAAAALYLAVQYFYVGWDPKAQASALSIAVLEISLLVPLLDFIRRSKQRRAMKHLAKEMNKQQELDLDGRFVEIVISLFCGLVSDLDETLKIRRRGKGISIEAADEIVDFAAYREDLERHWRNFNRIAVPYIPYLTSHDGVSLARITWMNALFQELDRVLNNLEDWDEGTGTLRRERKVELSELAAALGEVGKWLYEAGDVEDAPQRDFLIVSFFNKFGNLLDDEYDRSWYDNADLAHFKEESLAAEA